MATFTQATWAASIEAAGTLTAQMTVGHLDQALADIDPAMGAILLGGVALSGSQVVIREELLIMRSLYNSLVATVPPTGGLLSAAARTLFIGRGQAGYT